MRPTRAEEPSCALLAVPMVVRGRPLGSIVAHATSLAGGIPPSAAGALPSVVAFAVAAFCLWKS